MPINLSFNTKTLLGRKKTRSQLIYDYTDDGRRVVLEPVVLKSCICQDTTCSAWVMDANNQVRDDDTKLWVQLVNDSSIMPIPAVIGESKTKDLEALTHQIFHDSWVIDLITMNDESRKDKNRTWWFVLFGTPILLAALILGLKVLKL
jgi:hypothetical protein